MSPRRYAGWEPAVTYHYDEDGRLDTTVSEPEWDDFDVALIDELRNWQAGLYSCGHHQSQSAAGLVHQPGYTVCKSCEALQKAQEKQKGLDKAELDQGRNPDFARRWFVRVMSMAQAMTEAKARARKRTPQELMDEAVRKMDAVDAPELTPERGA